MRVFVSFAHVDEMRRGTRQGAPAGQLRRWPNACCMRAGRSFVNGVARTINDRRRAVLPNLPKVEIGLVHRVGRHRARICRLYTLHRFSVVSS